MIKECVREVLEERATIGPEKHFEHHQWMDTALPKLDKFLDYRDARMKQIEERKALWNFARNTAIGSLVVGLMGFLAWVGKLVIAAVIRGG